MGVNGLVLDIDNPSIGARHHLLVGTRQIDLTALPTPPTLAPPTAGRAIYGISVGAEDSAVHLVRRVQLGARRRCSAAAAQPSR